MPVIARLGCYPLISRIAANEFWQVECAIDTLLEQASVDAGNPH